MRRALWLVCFALLCVPSLSGQTINRSRYGIVEGLWLPQLACELGVGWERIIFDWSEHQPTGEDDWNPFNVPDEWLKQADVCNREVVALLKHTPAWATDGLPSIGVPRGLHLPIDDPANLWAGFVRKVVRYYASRGVKHYIIWNEPDIEAGVYGYEFGGTLADYAQMLKVAYLTAKATDPTTIIHLAGTTYWHDVNNGRTLYLDRLLTHLEQDPEAAAHGYYFEVVSLHIYFRSDSVLRIINDTRDILAQHNMMDKTIWITETNAAPTLDPEWEVDRPQFPLDLQQQAAFLWQMTVFALSAGVERIAVYKLYDQFLPPKGESFGITNPATAQPRPAYYAWQAIVRYLDDIEDIMQARTRTLYATQVRHTNGRDTFVLWARRDYATVATISATGDKAYLIDQEGNLTIVMPENGVYNIALPPARCDRNDGCYIGGVVRLLVQPSGGAVVSEHGMTVPLLP
jgi:hypothetical protein